MPRVSSPSRPLGTPPSFGGPHGARPRPARGADSFGVGHAPGARGPAAPRPAHVPGGASAVPTIPGALGGTLGAVGARAWTAAPTTSANTGWPTVGHTTSTSDALTAYATPGPPLFPALTDEALLSALRSSYLPTTHHSYSTARGFLFGEVDNPAGTARCVYTGRTLATHGIPKADGPQGMNTEHTFPQGWLKGVPSAISDLHHLFPTDTKANELRGSYPFGEVVHATWTSSDGQAKLGKNAHGAVVFEPPADHKGNVARAMFYISGLYDVPLSATHEAVLRKWADADPVDPDEVARNARVKAVQGNSNPFIDAPALEKRVADF